MLKHYSTQNDLLLHKLMKFYNKDENIDKVIPILNSSHILSIRLIDWFVTNYSKKNFTMYNIYKKNENNEKTLDKRFKVFNEYKLKLKAYSKKRFDPFCRSDKIHFPYKNNYIETTIAQLNFFKWCLENQIIQYIENHKQEIEHDMNSNNTSAKNKYLKKNTTYDEKKTRKKREELSISAIKSIKKEDVEIVVKFN